MPADIYTLSSSHTLRLSVVTHDTESMVFQPTIEHVPVPQVVMRHVGKRSRWSCLGCGCRFYGSHAKRTLFDHLLAAHYYDRVSSPMVPLIAAPSRSLGPQPVTSSSRPARYAPRPSSL